MLIAAGADGREVAGRLAVRTNAGWLNDLVEVDGQREGTHSIFGGAFTVQSRATTDTAVISWRAGSIEVEENAGEAVGADPHPAGGRPSHVRPRHGPARHVRR